MKRFGLLFSVVVFLIMLVIGTSGCGSSRIQNNGVPTPTPTPTPIPPGPASGLGFAFLRNDGITSASAQTITQQEHQSARRASKITHGYQAAMPFDSTAVNIYVWPFTNGNGGWWFGSERKITASADAYTSVHLSLGGTSMVFSAIVNGYNQIFTATVPPEGKTLEERLQLTTDAENHWLPHLYADGSMVVFTKFDPNSNGDVVCIMDNIAGATENCLDFSSTTPILKGANIWHASWGLDGKIFFEAWGGPLNSDEIYMVNSDWETLTQITSNAGTKNYDECPSIFSDGNRMAVDTWNEDTHHYEVGDIDLNTKQRFTFSDDTHADAWDPLATPYSPVWVSQRDTDQSLELYILTFDVTRMTTNAYADYFESSPK
jgi:hypothetical protein